MKMQAAMKIINNPAGYLVHFEWLEGGLLRGDHFPDKKYGDDLIETEEEAWELAEKFAANTEGQAVNFYVTHANHTPVEGYRSRQIENR